MIETLRMQLEALDPLDLGHWPTPLEPLPRVSRKLGRFDVWVKRDDQTGLATGGNKARKLAYLMAEAVRQGADPVMTTGAQQSNHARQTAAAAARAGLPCVLVLGGEPPAAAQGNYLLDTILGAEVRWAGEQPLMAALTREATALREAGRAPYVIPYGGSNSLGVCGYVAAMLELWEQMRARDLHFGSIVVASSSGGTQAGLLVGARALGYPGRILGISIAEPAKSFRQEIAQLANGAAKLLALDIAIAPADVLVSDAYLGGGYGVVSDLEREAIALAGRTEGLLVDPVYTGRALGGLIAQARQGTFAPGERVLFWHTGGTPALFAYGDAALPKEPLSP